ncbi:MAG: PKD domain-containing protein [Actinobacteria bacterium]|nr:PKD domain-containing protein [Actinomycetota bacterium]
MKRLAMITVIVGALLLLVRAPGAGAATAGSPPPSFGRTPTSPTSEKMLQPLAAALPTTENRCVIPEDSLNQVVELGQDAGGFRRDLPGTVLIAWEVEVLWGDGTATHHNNEIEITHRYSAAGTYNVLFMGRGLKGPSGGPFTPCNDYFTFTVTVLPPPNVTVDDVALSEGDSKSTAFSFTVELSRASKLPATVTYKTQDDSAVAPDDYSAATGTLSFSPDETSKTAMVEVKGDIVVEPDETLHLKLLSATGAVIAKADGLGTIVNDDAGPTASFTITVHPGGSVDFDGSASQPGSGRSPIVGYEWSFGDGTGVSGSTSKVQHVYPDPTSFTATLVVTDQAGNRSDEATVTVDTCAPDVAPVDGDEYAGLVRCVEAAFPSAPPRTVLSIMRQLYYGGEAWSKRVDRKWANIIPCGIAMPDPRPALAPKLYAALIKAKDTVMPGDPSHLFTGAEALACPIPTVEFPPIPGVPLNLWSIKMPNYLIATWGGDIGAAAGLKAFDESSGSVRPWAHYFGAAGIRASFRDLEGDVDSIVFSYAAHGRPCSDQPTAPLAWTGMPISQALKNYYSAQANAQSAYRFNRTACFLDIFAGPSGRSNVFVATYKSNVEDFAESYFLSQSGGSSVVKPANQRLVRDRSLKVIEMFEAWVSGR